MDEELGLSIEEKISAHPYVPKPGAKETPRWTWPRYDYTPSGRLTVRLHGNLPSGSAASWQDGKVQRVERIADRIIIGLFTAAEGQTQKRLDDERRRREWEEQERRDEEDRRLRRLEIQRRQHLDKLASRYEQSIQLRQFLNAVEAHRDRLSATLVQGVPFTAWLEWATNYVKHLDPLTDLGCWDIEKQVPLWRIHES